MKNLKLLKRNDKMKDRGKRDRIKRIYKADIFSGIECETIWHRHLDAPIIIRISIASSPDDIRLNEMHVQLLWCVAFTI